MRHSPHRPATPRTAFLGSFASDIGIVLVAAAVLLVVYLLDTITPLGQPVWLLYFIPLILSFWSERPYAIPTVCSVTLLFLVAGLFISPQGIPFTLASGYRFSFFVIYIAVGAVLWIIRRQRMSEDQIV